MEPQEPSEIQLYINSYRSKYSWSQEQFAKVVKAKQEQVSVWESGKHRPSTLRMEEIKRRLGRYDKRYKKPV